MELIIKPCGLAVLHQREHLFEGDLSFCYCLTSLNIMVFIWDDFVTNGTILFYGWIYPWDKCIIINLPIPLLRGIWVDSIHHSTFDSWYAGLPCTDHIYDSLFNRSIYKNNISIYPYTQTQIDILRNSYILKR